MKTVSDTACDIETKPLQETVCNAHNPCPGFSKILFFLFLINNFIFMQKTKTKL